MLSKNMGHVACCYVMLYNACLNLKSVVRIISIVLSLKLFYTSPNLLFKYTPNTIIDIVNTIINNNIGLDKTIQPDKTQCTPSTCDLC